MTKTSYELMAEQNAIRAERDAAIRAAGSVSWHRQALVGLASFPPGYKGDAGHFSYMLTSGRSPLDSPHLSPRDDCRHRRPERAWGAVFREALRLGLIEHTHFTRNDRGQWVMMYTKTRRWRISAKPAAGVCRCGKPIVAKRSTKTYCSTACRVAAHRAKLETNDARRLHSGP